ncbi:MAG: metal-dependent hydrolase [Candidatus Acidiferrales bacterium]
MEPATHALASLALARAAGKRLPRFGTAMIVVCGLAPDLDYSSYFGGAGALLRFHRTAVHSVLGAALMAGVVAGAFCRLDRKRPRDGSTSPLGFPAAFAACCAGAALHLALDLTNISGVQLLWPFRAGWFSWDIAPWFDPWILAILIAGLLLPHLFRLINEEIGEREKSPVGRGAAIAALLLLAAYMGARANLHGRAMGLLLSVEYHGREPLSAGAFPTTLSPWDWRGVASTDGTIEEVDVPLGSNADFDPDSLTQYKPEDSTALEAGRQTAAARRFLGYARFPLASVSQFEDGYRFELRDLRFPAGDTSPENMIVRVDFDSSLRVVRQEIRFASSTNP